MNEKETLKNLLALGFSEFLAEAYIRSLKKYKTFEKFVGYQYGKKWDSLDEFSQDHITKVWETKTNNTKLHKVLK